MMSREILEKLTQKQLIDAYIGLAFKYKKLEQDFSKSRSDLSWIKNPDRSGGQFTDEEIERSRNGYW